MRHPKNIRSTINIPRILDRILKVELRKSPNWRKYSVSQYLKFIYSIEFANGEGIFELKHDERWALAESIAKRAVEQYHNQILFVAVAGMTANNKDGDFADLDMLIASKDKIGESRKFVYKDIIAEPFFITEGEAQNIFKDPSNSEWFSWMMHIHTAKVIYGDQNALKEFQKFDSSIPNEAYAKQSGVIIVLLREYVNHMKAVLSYGKLADSLLFSIEFQSLAAQLVALLNRKYYLSYDSLGEAKMFNILPENYANLMTKLGSSLSVQDILSVSSDLLDNCIAVAHRNGVREESYSSLENVRL